MARLNAANLAQSLLDGAITDTADTMTVLDGSIFPDTPFAVTVEDEIIYVIVKSGSTFSSILRAQEGTTAVAHTNGVSVENRMTAGMYNALATQEEVDGHKADTMPHAELVNRTITVGVGKDFKTIQGAINSLKKRLNAIITINVDVGVYDEYVEIRGFTGAGTLNLYGGTDLSEAVNYKVNSISQMNNTLKVSIRGFNAISTTNIAFFIERAVGAEFISCIATGNALEYTGFYAGYSIAYFMSCQCNNHKTAVQADNSSILTSREWTAGSGNTIGLLASHTSVIGKHGTQPQGTTTETVVYGGEIR